MSGHFPSQTEAMPRLNNVQALRGLAAFMVMLSHLFFIEQKYSDDTLLPNILNFGMTGVDIFFVISGFIMVYVTHKWRGAAARQTPEFLFARITRIYPLYWVVSGALLLVYIIKPEWVFASSAGSDPNIVRSFLLLPNKEAYPLLEVGWTLIHEMGFYLIFTLVLFAPRRLRPLLICFWAAIVGGGNMMGWHELNSTAQIFFHPLSFEFCGGALLAYWLLKPVRLGSPIAWLIASITLFIASLFVFKLIEQSNPGMGWLRVFTFGSSALLILLAAFAFEQRGKIAPKWCVTLGDWSYALYLTHVLTLSVIGRIWALWDRPTIWDNLIMLPLLIMGTIIVAGLTRKTIEAPMMRASKYLQKKWFKT